MEGSSAKRFVESAEYRRRVARPLQSMPAWTLNLRSISRLRMLHFSDAELASHIACSARVDVRAPSDGMGLTRPACGTAMPDG
jgi:hypothetical protein